MLLPYTRQGRTPRPSKSVNTLGTLRFARPPAPKPAPAPAPAAGQTPTQQPQDQEKPEAASQTSEVTGQMPLFSDL